MNNEQYNRYLEDCYGAEDFQSLREFSLPWGKKKSPQNFDDLVASQAKEQAKKTDISETLKQISFSIYQNKDKDIGTDNSTENKLAVNQAKSWKQSLKDSDYNITTINQLVQNIYKSGLSQPNNDKKTNKKIQVNLKAIDILSNATSGSENSLQTIVQKTLSSNKALKSLYSAGNTSTQNNTNATNNEGHDDFATAQAGLKADLEKTAKGLYSLPDKIKDALGYKYGIDANAAPAVILKDISTILKQQPAALKGLSKTLINMSNSKNNENKNIFTTEQITQIESAAKSLGNVINQANTAASAAARKQAMLHPEIAAQAEAQAAASQEALNKKNTELVNTFLQSLAAPSGNFAVGVAKDLKANHGWDGDDAANAQAASTIIQAGLDNAQTNVNQFINSLNTTGMNLIKTGQTLGKGNSSSARSSSSSSGGGTSGTLNQGLVPGEGMDRKILPHQD